MNIPTKTLRHGFTMPEFGLGTWQMGGLETRNPDNDDRVDIEAVCSAIESGITHIDTAEIYADGRAEEIVAEAIRPYNRGRLFLASKVSRFHLNYNDIKQAIKNSLARLGTDYLDLYYLHRCPPEETFTECFKAMNELVDEGYIRHIGISNFNTAHTKHAQEISKHPIAATQVHYNLIFREPEHAGLLTYCQKHDIILVAWRPVQKGRLTEASTPFMAELCARYKKTPSQIAINWLTSQANVVTLAKTSNLKHLKENLGAIGWHLHPEDVERLRLEFPGQQAVSDTIPLG